MSSSENFGQSLTRMNERPETAGNPFLRGRIMTHWIGSALLGIAAGWLAGQITKGSGFGLIGDLIIGLVGALVGQFLFGILGFRSSGLIASLITATVGAVVLLAILRTLKG